MKFFYDNRGVTLIELSVVIMIFMIISVISSNFVLQTLKADKMGVAIGTSIKSANNALLDISRELRNAGSSDLGGFAIATATSQELVFYSNADNDPGIERVRYFIEGEAFMKGVTKATGSPLAYDASSEVFRQVAVNVQNGTSSVFYYFDTNGNELLNAATQKGRIKTIRVSIIVNSSSGKSISDYLAETDILVRNLNIY